MSTPGGRVRSSMSGGGGPQPEFHLRDFSGGMRCYGDREALRDEEMWWCENLLPKTAGNLANVPITSSAIATLTDAGGASPIYAMGFAIGTVPYVFIVNNSGAGWVVNLNTHVATKIIASGLTQPFATQYSNTGILIIDPSGYWDWGVTTPLTLTPWNNSIASFTPTGLGGTTVAGATTLHQVLTVSGTGGSFEPLFEVISITISAAGTGYVVGDVLSFTDNSPISPAMVTVTTVGGGGTITGIGGLIPGSYPGPTSTSGFVTGPGGAVYTGGTGTGATFAIKIQAAGMKVLAPGHGYSNSDTVGIATAVPVVIVSYTIVTSGLIGGVAVETYAGRVWIASGRSVFVTDINSYNSFGGAGLTFTINDAYLYNIITALFAANNYLYIFGINSIDAVSNVTVSATTGLTSFTRINIVQGIGTNSPASVFAYYRSVAFFDQSGFYILNGATPEKISERITGIVTAITNLSTVNPVYGGVVNLQGELCASFSFLLADTFSGRTSASRVFTALYVRGRWWIYNFNNTLNFAAATPAHVSVVTSPTALSQLVQIGNPSGTTTSIFIGFGGGGNAAWILRTRLWDGQAILREKQALNAALAAIMGSTGGSGCSFKIDTELADGTVQTSFPLSDNTPAYRLMVEAAQGGSSQYIGMTINGDGTDTTQVKLVALKGKTDRSFLE
jgi:hypothetical protein